jgi:hypothetical protein
VADLAARPERLRTEAVQIAARNSRERRRCRIGDANAEVMKRSTPFVVAAAGTFERRGLARAPGRRFHRCETCVDPHSVYGASIMPSALSRSLDTTRFECGFVAQRQLSERYVLTARFSAHKTEHHRRGDDFEHDIQNAVFTELALRGRARRQTWVVGLAFEHSTLDPQRSACDQQRQALPSPLSLPRLKSRLGCVAPRLPVTKKAADPLTSLDEWLAA